MAKDIFDARQFSVNGSNTSYEVTVYRDGTFDGWVTIGITKDYANPITKLNEFPKKIRDEVKNWVQARRDKLNVEKLVRGG